MLFFGLISLSLPILNLLYVRQISSALLIWGGLLIFYLIFAFIHKKAILGGSEYYFLLKNEVGKVDDFILNILVLFSANVYLFIPFFILFISIFYQENSSQHLLGCFTIFSWLLIILLLQFALIFENKKVFLFLLLFSFFSISLIPLTSFMFSSLLLNIFIIFLFSLKVMFNKKIPHI